jgi:hypothetical protein
MNCQEWLELQEQYEECFYNDKEGLFLLIKKLTRAIEALKKVNKEFYGLVSAETLAEMVHKHNCAVEVYLYLQTIERINQ